MELVNEDPVGGLHLKKRRGLRAPKLDRWWKVVLVLAAAVVIDFWGIGLIPFEKFFGENFWAGFAFHVTGAICWVALMRIFVPGSLTRLRFRRLTKQQVIAAIAVILIFADPFTSGISLTTNSAVHIVEVLIFSLSIGLDEELFSRGLTFGIFERYGWRVALAISSVEFGLMHYSNIAWGGQDFGYTSAQVLNAACFGFLSAALMLYTGSIWISMAFHGLSDFPMMFQSQSEHTASISGGVAWGPILLQCALYLATGVGLLFLHRGRESESLERVLRYFGMVQKSDTPS